jgi:hypothetical protein
MDEERLNRLTPRERDVYEVLRRHPDWRVSKIGCELALTPNAVRGFVWNIRRKLEAPDWPHPEDA